MKKIIIFFFAITLLNLISCDNTNEVKNELGFYGIVLDEFGNPIADADVCIIPLDPFNKSIINKDNSENDIQSTEVAELVSFIAREYTDYIEIKWTTGSELNVDKFELERSLNSPNPLEFKTIYTVKSSGNSISQKNYSFKDEDIESNKTYIYRIKIIDKDSSVAKSETIIINSKLIPTDLNSVFPNPFKYYVNIPFSLTKSQKATIEIIEKASQKIYFSQTQEFKAGFYNYQWQAKNTESIDSTRPLRPGIYTVYLKTQDTTLNEIMYHTFRFDVSNCQIPLEVTKTDKDGKFFIPYNWFPSSELIKRTLENGQLTANFFLGDTSMVIVRKVIESDNISISYQVAQEKFKIDKSKISEGKLVSRKYIIKK